jgi:hypothetical protein
MRVVGAVLAASLVLAGSSRAQESPAGPGAPPPTSLAPVPRPAEDPTAAPAVEPAPGPPATDAATALDLAVARAASASPSAPAGPRGSLPAATEVTIDRRNAFVAGLRFGGPTGAGLRLSLAHGLGADVREEKERVDVVCAVPIPHCAGGFLLDAEAGSGGGKISLGLGANAKVQSEDFRGTVGAGLRLSLAQTWGSPIGTEPGLTYLGPELDLYVVRIGLNLGVLWRVAGEGGSSALFTWGLGFRL